MKLEKKLEVLYIFDKYLNRTMNWAYRLMKYAPNTQPVISSPLIVKNEFFDPDFEFINSPFQIQTPDNEWDVNIYQRGINYLTSRALPIFQKQLFQKLKNRKIDLIHIHFGNVACRYLDLVKKLKKPLVVTFHGYDYESVFIKRPELKTKYKALFEYASLVTCGGPAGKNRLIKNGCPPEKIQILRLGIEPKKIPIFERIKAKKQLRILQAGTITEKKGHIFTVKAFAKAIQNCPNMHLTILGEKENSTIISSLNQIIQNQNLQEQIEFKDILTYEQFIQFSANFDAFIHPSCTAKNGDCEGGTPLVIQDMMATGMPVISTTHADIEEGVLHGKNGFLSDEKDIDDLATSIEKFYYMDEIEYSLFCQNARKHIETNYQMSKSGKLLRQLYEGLIP
jgi:colanic acid/amylovoran biosynthesis glycosyltransferase